MYRNIVTWAKCESNQREVGWAFARMTSQTMANIVTRNDTTPSRKVVEYAGIHGNCVELPYMAQPSTHPTMQRYSECGHERKSAKIPQIGCETGQKNMGSLQRLAGTWANLLLDKNKNGHNGSSSQECRSEPPPIDLTSSRIFKSFPVFSVKQAFSLQQCLSGQQCHGH